MEQYRKGTRAVAVMELILIGFRLFLFALYPPNLSKTVWTDPWVDNPDAYVIPAFVAILSLQTLEAALLFSATLEILCIVELFCFWWNSNAVISPGSYLAMKVLVTEVLVLQVLAAINLFVSTLSGNALPGAVLLCQFWLVINIIWVCLAYLGVLVLLLIFFTMGRAYGASLISDRQIPTYIVFFQIELCLRLMGIPIVVKFIEKLKLVIPIALTPREIALRELQEAEPLNL